jgi:hypothetical protein
MSREDVEILRRLYERWGRGDFATSGAFDPQVEFVRIGDADDMTGAPGQWRGIDGLAAAVAEWTQEWEEVRSGGAFHRGWESGAGALAPDGPRQAQRRAARPRRGRSIRAARRQDRALGGVPGPGYGDAGART